MDVSSSAFKKEKSIVQNTRKPGKQEQQFGYDNGFIYNSAYPGLVLDIKGENAKDGAHIILYNRKETDNMNQLWDMESHANFEGSLNLAATDSMTHKKESFGLPTPGYGAQINCPPGLTSVPDRPQLQYSDTNASTYSQDDYGYQGSSLQASHPQQPYPSQAQGQGQPVHSPLANYPPSSQSYNSPPPPQYGGSQNSQYPPPPPPRNQDYNYAPPPSSGGYSNYPPPQQPQQQQQGYPPQGYPPQGGYSSPPQGGYSSPPQGGYLNQGQQGGYSNQGQQGGNYSQGGYGQPQGSYGQSQGGSYGQPPSGYGQSQGGYGQPQGGYPPPPPPKY
ncbi:hypothetical protein NQZ79_g5208 [Umbelopsis isabellina]|nr:hypothetical protein NQZ79_g5208 [Umbelopsis isabellina]